MKTDSLFYRLFHNLPQLLFDLIEEPSDQAVHYRFTSVELKQTAFRVDGIFSPPEEHPDWPIFFIEVQFQPDPKLYARLFAEVFLYLRQQSPPHPWQAVVIYPTRALDPGDHPHYHALLHSGQVTRVYLDEWVQPRQTRTQQVIAILLADPQRAVNEARSVLAQIREETGIDTALTTSIVNLVETILVYKLPTLSRKEIQAMLELTDTDLKQTRFYQEVFEEGEKTGRQEGRQEGEAILVLRLLQRRCGELSPVVQEHITHLSLPQLEALGEALLEFHGSADLERWLEAHGRE